MSRHTGAAKGDTPLASVLFPFHVLPGEDPVAPESGAAAMRGDSATSVANMRNATLVFDASSISLSPIGLVAVPGTGFASHAAAISAVAAELDLVSGTMDIDAALTELWGERNSDPARWRDALDEALAGISSSTRAPRH